MSPPKRVLITGGSGYLGQHVVQKATQTYTVASTYASNPEQINDELLYQLDITHKNQVEALVAQIKPQAIIHCIAANPGCDEQTMMAINAEGTRYIAEAAIKQKARLVHVSTDMVHDGQNSPYHDDAAPTPTSVYGHSKAQAERYVQQIDPSAAIVRTSLIYGLERMDRGTAGFVKRLESESPLILFRDVYRQPVWAETLATALLKLAFETPNFSGMLNVVGRQLIDRETFGRRMLAWWGIPDSAQIKSGLGADLANPPPLNVELNVKKAETVLDMTFWGVEDVLSQAQAKIKSDQN